MTAFSKEEAEGIEFLVCSAGLGLNICCGFDDEYGAPVIVFETLKDWLELFVFETLGVWTTSGLAEGGLKLEFNLWFWFR